MKRNLWSFLLITFVSVLLSVSCKNEKTNISTAEDWKFDELYTQAKKAPVTETKLFGGFELNMNEQQVDSVIKSMYEAGKIEYYFDINQDSAIIHDESVYTIGSSAYRFWHKNTSVYITFRPEYLSGRLVGLFCIIKPVKGQKYEQPLFKVMADIFKDSDRGRTFTYFEQTLETADGKEEKMFKFIKGNLFVAFYPQTSEEGTMYYRNIPDAEAYWAEQEKDNDSAKDL